MAGVCHNHGKFVVGMTCHEIGEFTINMIHNRRLYELQPINHHFITVWLINKKEVTGMIVSGKRIARQTFYGLDHQTNISATHRSGH